MVSQEKLKELFDYREDGFLICKTKRKRLNIGDVAGSFNIHTRYYNIRCNGKSYLGHRLIFLWHKGYLPDIIDHIDNDTTNSRIDNLREASHVENMRNSKSRKNSSSQYLGVWENKLKVGVSWCAGLRFNLKNVHIGSFKTEEEAALAYNKHAVKHFKEFANLNIIKPNEK